MRVHALCLFSSILFGVTQKFTSLIVLLFYYAIYSLLLEAWTAKQPYPTISFAPYQEYNPARHFQVSMSLTLHCISSSVVLEYPHLEQLVSGKIHPICIYRWEFPSLWNTLSYIGRILFFPLWLFPDWSTTSDIRLHVFFSFLPQSNPYIDLSIGIYTLIVNCFLKPFALRFS